LKKSGINGLCSLALLGFAAILATAAQAQNYSVLYNFGTNTGDPKGPRYSGVIAQGRDGNLYSTTPYGGANGPAVNGWGAVFKVTPGGRLTTLYSFTGNTDGCRPSGGLTLGTDGNFYGTTQGSDCSEPGTIFRITPAGKLTTLYTFTCKADGCYPLTPPVEGRDGNFYGTTPGGAPFCTVNCEGAIYRITPSGTFTVLHDFSGDDGQEPLAPLVLGTDGKLYGTTLTNTAGTSSIFEISTSGDFTSFLGGSTRGALVQAGDGNFYGATETSGGDGLIFRFTPNGTLTWLYDLTGEVAGGLIQATDGNLYGATGGGGTLGAGTIFRISTKGTGFSVLKNFDYTDGAGGGLLMLHTSGTLYGETGAGGTTAVGQQGGWGVFYGLKTKLKPFVTPVPYSGKVGKTVGILGQGFTSATTVSFNGIAASTTLKSSTYLTAVVPPGATTGLATVTTSGGTLTSNNKFVVVP
jgi:uncharacterized repeat protein (TIGR03803 family)